MKHLFAASLLLATILGVQAQSFRSLAVNLKDGSSVEVALSDDFSAYFDEDNFIITGVGRDVTVPRKALKSYTFMEKDLASTDNVGVDDETPVIAGGFMKFSSLPEGSTITVYDLEGRQLLQQNASGEYTLPLSGFAAPAVIVKVNKVSYKVTTTNR